MGAPTILVQQPQQPQPRIIQQRTVRVSLSRRSKTAHFPQRWLKSPHNTRHKFISTEAHSSFPVRPLHTDTPAAGLDTDPAAEADPAATASPTATASAATPAGGRAAAAARADADEGADGGGAGDVPDGEPRDAAREGAHPRVHGRLKGQPLSASR